MSAAHTAASSPRRWLSVLADQPVRPTTHDEQMPAGPATLTGAADDGRHTWPLTRGPHGAAEMGGEQR